MLVLIAPGSSCQGDNLSLSSGELSLHWNGFEIDLLLWKYIWIYNIHKQVTSWYCKTVGIGIGIGLCETVGKHRLLPEISPRAKGSFWRKELPSYFWNMFPTKKNSGNSDARTFWYEYLSTLYIVIFIDKPFAKKNSKRIFSSSEMLIWFDLLSNKKKARF